MSAELFSVISNVLASKGGSTLLANTPEHLAELRVFGVFTRSVGATRTLITDRNVRPIV